MRVRIDHADGHDIVSDLDIPAFLKRYPIIRVQRLGHTGQLDPFEPYHERTAR